VRAGVGHQVGVPGFVDRREVEATLGVGQDAAEAERRGERGSFSLGPLGEQAGAAQRRRPPGPLVDQRAAVAAAPVVGVHRELGGARVEVLPVREVEAEPADRVTVDLREHQVDL
jgi:hypothetical protein